jgi:hypothetical protein
MNAALNGLGCRGSFPLLQPKLVSHPHTEARIIFAAYAALKRRSSTLLPFHVTAYNELRKANKFAESVAFRAL